MATTYYPSVTASAVNKNTVTAPAASAKLLQTAIGSANSLTITLPASGVNLDHWLIGEPNDPDTTGGTGARAFAAKLNVTTANANLTGLIQYVRLNSAGTAQTSVGWGIATSWPQTTGLKSSSDPSINLGTFAAGDRFAIQIRFSNGSSMVTASVVLEVGLANGNEEFTAPWTLAAPERAGVLKTPTVVRQAVNRSATWMKRRSGIVVPRLWTPVDA